MGCKYFLIHSFTVSDTSSLGNARTAISVVDCMSPVVSKNLCNKRTPSLLLPAISKNEKVKVSRTSGVAWVERRGRPAPSGKMSLVKRVEIHDSFISYVSGCVALSLSLSFARFASFREPSTTEGKYAGIY